MLCRNGNWRIGTRLIALCVVAFSLLGFTADLHAQSNQAGSRQAVLHISVVVMPIVQALNVSPSLPPPKTSINYTLETTPQEKRYEVRPLPPDVAQADKQTSAILKTLVVVPE
jgi:hypothetical protein